ncbi:integrase domain-containing protein [Rhizobium sp. NXC14]|nr:integrase domain-containing protein [Rhizobium sp. NXC14]
MNCRRRAQALRHQRSAPRPNSASAWISRPMRRRGKSLIWPREDTGRYSSRGFDQARGLRWEDVDLKKGQLHVRQRADRYGIVGMPKSEAGQQTVPLPPIAVNTLKEWRLACPDSQLGLVFPNQAGNIEFHNNMLQPRSLGNRERCGPLNHH